MNPSHFSLVLLTTLGLLVSTVVSQQQQQQQPPSLVEPVPGAEDRESSWSRLDVMSKWNLPFASPRRPVELPQTVVSKALPADPTDLSAEDLELLKKISATPGQHEYSIARPEGNRTFYVWVPKIYVNSSYPVPLHLTFHGLGDTCQNFGPATNFASFAEARNFLFVYPCSTVGLIGSCWNAGTCCCQPTSVDDVTFARLIVNFMEQMFRVNSTRVYASGFSNGAMMAEILGCTAPDVFVSTASVSGCVELEPGNSGGLQKCSQDYSSFGGRAVSTINIHGTLDFVVPYTGDELLGFPDIPTDFKDWAIRNNCTGAPVQTFKKGTFSNQVYQSCTRNTVVELMTNEFGGHEWPETSDFSTSEYICDFFHL